MDEIQRAIAAESQSSRGSASIGNGGASVVGGAGGVCNTLSLSTFHHLLIYFVELKWNIFTDVFLFTKATDIVQNVNKQVIVCIVCHYPTALSKVQRMR